MAANRVETGANVKTIVIVGAGAAGLQAAKTLLDHQACITGRLKVILLEARDRVGGRIYVDRKWGTPLDHGPNWIHGTLFNPLVPLAKATRTRLTFPEEAHQIVYMSFGWALPLKTSRTLYEHIWRYADEAIQYSADPNESIPPEWSVFEFCITRISEDPDLDNTMKTLAIEMVEMLTTFTAADVRKQSLRHYQVEAEFPGEKPFVASTFEPILQHLSRPLERARILHLSTPVTKVSTHADHLAVHTPSRILSADAVILTVPLGCLQRSTINFEPPLPTRVISAIKNLGFGNLEKLFLKFDEAWWNDPFSTKEPPEIFTFLPPSTLPPACPRRLLTMFSLANLPINAQPVLAIYLAADWTTFIASQSHESIASVFQNHYLPCLPNYHRNYTIREVFCTQWTTDPWTYGSYTHIPVGSQDGIEDLRILGEKIVGLENGVGGLWLAGEHAGTADVGTVNGAMTSGKLAAVEILKAFGETVEQDTE